MLRITTRRVIVAVLITGALAWCLQGIGPWAPSAASEVSHLRGDSQPPPPDSLAFERKHEMIAEVPDVFVIRPEGEELGVDRALKIARLPADELRARLEEDRSILKAGYEGGTSPLMLAIERSRPENVRLMLEYGAAVGKPGSVWSDWLLYTAISARRHRGRMLSLLIAAGARPGVDGQLGFALSSAVGFGDVGATRLLLETGADVNAVTGTGRAALHGAASTEEYAGALTRLLLEYGAAPNPVDEKGVTPLMRAKEEGADEMVDILLAHIEEKTIPELIAMGEKEELLEAMRSKPFRLSEPDSTGRVPLHYAAKLGGNDILESLLDMGAKPDAKNKEAQTPLHVVVEKGNRKGVELLLKAGADVDCTDEHGDTPLHYAAGEEQAKLVADLLEAGADPNARNNSLGRTPVHVASSKGSVSILEKLMAAGGDIHQKDASGEDALFVATRQGELRAMDLLTKRGAEPTQNSAGENLVHAATFGSEAEAVKRALELGCDINHASKSGLTPLHLAAAVYSFKDGACVETLRFLLENGADRDAKDEKGRTPIELAKPGWVRHMIKTGGKMPPEPDTNVHDPEATETAE